MQFLDPVTHDRDGCLGTWKLPRKRNNKIKNIIKKRRRCLSSTQNPLKRMCPSASGSMCFGERLDFMSHFYCLCQGCVEIDRKGAREVYRDRQIKIKIFTVQMDKERHIER